MNRISLLFLFTLVITLGKSSFAATESEQKAAELINKNGGAVNLEVCNLLQMSSEIRCSTYDGANLGSTNISKVDICNRCMSIVAASTTKDTAKIDQCKELRQKVADAKKDFNRSCKDLGVKCDTFQSQNCDEEASSELYSGLSAISSAYGANLDTMSSSCGSLSGEDYFDSRDKLENEIKDLNKKIAEAKKDMAEEQKKSAEEQKHLNEELQANQKKFKDVKREISESEREDAQKLMQVQQADAENSRKLEKDLVDLKIKYSNSMIELDKQMLQISDSTAKTSCMLGVKKAADELKKQMLSSNATNSSAIAQSDQLRATLTDQYNNCMISAVKQREALAKSKKDQMDIFNKEINDKQASLTALAQKTKQDLANLNEKKNENAAKLQEEYQDLMTKIQQAQQDLVTLTQTAAQKQQASQEELQNLQRQVFLANNRLNTLGPQPRNKKSKETVITVSQAKADLDAAKLDYRSTCCNVSDGTNTYTGTKDGDCKDPDAKSGKDKGERAKR